MLIKVEIEMLSLGLKGLKGDLLKSALKDPEGD